MSPIDSLTQLPAPSITLALGGLTTAYVFFGNITDTQRGLIAYLNGRLTPIKLGDKDRAKVWFGYYDPAHEWVITVSLISSILNLSTSYTHKSNLISKLTLTSGITSILIVPYTFGVRLPLINSRLIELSKDSTEHRNENEAKTLIEIWEKKHLVRMVFYAGAWITSFAAIVLDGRI
ncbi:uncharacterized protein L201_007572 [Kwoniella dendrophila CBS 6074]|uniref:Mitochondrial protein n=1 Tax=Kwoniella dendrophila CBS 6074 TaxID=1295534 RepID=A0AAX4K695_9TREE